MLIGFTFYRILTKGNEAVEENWSAITPGGGESLHQHQQLIMKFNLLLKMRISIVMWKQEEVDLLLFSHFFFHLIA